MPRLSKRRLEEILTRELRLRDPAFRLDATYGRISGSVISDTFKRKDDYQRQKMIWDALERALGPNAIRLIGMLLAYTKAEWNIDRTVVGAAPDVK
jgi:acid stress-induced BolA-like protein IbaG/YrbA